MQAAVCLTPATPTRSAYSSPTNCSNTPLRSSPLANSPASSPAAQAEARRRSHYKANPFSTPASHRQRDLRGYQTRRYPSHSPNVFVQGSSTQGASSTAPTEEPPRTILLRERLKTRCLERAAQKRERALARGSRHLSSDRSSDGMEEMMEEDDEEEETMLNDEVRAVRRFYLSLWTDTRC